jgi:hypothetical protein
MTSAPCETMFNGGIEKEMLREMRMGLRKIFFYYFLFHLYLTR